jgi:hypothetical protein
MADLGGLYSTLGQGEKAKSLLQDGLSMSRCVLGNTHWLTAYSAHGLGMLHSSDGQYLGAARALEESLTIATHVFGPGHPSVLKYTNDLGVLRREQQ